MKKVAIGMAVLALCAGMAMAEETEWCAAAICTKCKQYYEHTIPETSKGMAIKAAKNRLKLIHDNKDCKVPNIKGWADKGACPSPVAVERNGE